ncbi:MAG: hypothetical protein ACYDH3_01950 [Candidatus Aminicenantales bacterium]
MAFFQTAILFLAAICLSVPAAFSDGSTLLFQPVRIEKIDSVKVVETREFWVSLPDHYAESNEKYPVICAPPELTCRLQVIGKAGHVSPDSLRRGLTLLFEDGKIGQSLK